MAKFIPATNVSEAWSKAASYLIERDGWRAPHLVVSVEQPLVELYGVRAEIARLYNDDADISSTVDRVADTLFPQDLYDPGEADADKRLYERSAEAREFEMETVPGGNYYDYLVAYPFADPPFNQLEHALDRLRTSKRTNKNNSNQCEIGLTGLDLRIQTPGRHRSIYGFPCLSHISVTLAGGAISLAATYRAQDFSNKGYGNLVGLGRLTQFLALESGYEVGEVLCLATGASLQAAPAGARVLRDVISNVDQIVKGEKIEK